MSATTDTPLQRERLELYVIINLAHGRPAETSPIDTEPLLSRFRALKDAIDARDLPALPGVAGNPNANVRSRVALTDLRQFLRQRGSGPAWDWLVRFTRTWATARGYTDEEELGRLSSMPKARLEREAAIFLERLLDEGPQTAKKHYRAKLDEQVRGLTLKGFERVWSAVRHKPGREWMGKPGRRS